MQKVGRAQAVPGLCISAFRYIRSSFRVELPSNTGEVFVCLLSIPSQFVFSIITTPQVERNQKSVT